MIDPGEEVHADQDIIEVETNKATMNVTAPCRGRVEKLLAKLNESYPVGAVLGYVEASKEDAARSGVDEPAPEKEVEPVITTSEPDGDHTHGRRRQFNPSCTGCRCRPMLRAPAICPHD